VSTRDWRGAARREVRSLEELRAETARRKAAPAAATAVAS